MTLAGTYIMPRCVSNTYNFISPREEHAKCEKAKQWPTNHAKDAQSSLQHDTNINISIMKVNY